ncbi:hypothetical protein [Bacillus sp. FJAT-42315]|uniref:hypothetical protein n=1 Tax=Bacillus sp. FJAT-42315 TaxID=2014077 RepID=UPI000C247130|nr:hypothetical protein [Bacillus sp. FJAT-42315]
MVTEKEVPIASHFQQRFDRIELDRLLFNKGDSKNYKELADRAWKVLEKELMSNDPSIRIAAAEGILRVLK